MQINVDEKKLKKIAAVVNKMVTEDIRNNSESIVSNVVGSHNNYGYNKILQSICQGLFQVPYEELKVLLNKEVNLNNPTSRFYMLVHGDYIILSLEDKIITSMPNISDTTIDAVRSTAQKQASKSNAKFIEYHLPQLVMDLTTNQKQADEDIMSLAKKMGLFNDFGDIFTKIDSNSGVLIDGKYNNNTLDGEAFTNIVDAWEEDGYDHVVWSPEIETGRSLYEFFFSFDELCNAKTTDGIIWTIIYSGHELKIEFK